MERPHKPPTSAVALSLFESEGAVCRAHTLPGTPTQGQGGGRERPHRPIVGPPGFGGGCRGGDGPDARRVGGAEEGLVGGWALGGGCE
jgi:hypothetical protein